MTQTPDREIRLSCPSGDLVFVKTKVEDRNGDRYRVRYYRSRPTQLHSITTAYFNSNEEAAEFMADMASRWIKEVS